MTRLQRLREMRAWIDAEIREETERMASVGAETVIGRCAELYGTTITDVLAGDRKRQSANARQASCWLLRRHGLSFPRIGELLDLDHTTVMYACRKIDSSAAIKALLTPLAAA